MTRLDYEGEATVLAIILNGNHRIAQQILNKQGIKFEVIIAENRITGQTALRNDLDFCNPKCLDALGIKTDPRVVLTGYGINTIISKIRHFHLTGETLEEKTHDPINF